MNKLIVLTLAVASLVAATSAVAPGQLNIWPMPQVVTQTAGSPSSIATAFQFQTASKSQVLARAFQRYNEIMFVRPLSTTADNANDLNAISSLKVTVGTDDETLVDFVDESYLLTIQGNTSAINAETIWGAIRALESFSQLVTYNMESNTYEIPSSPLTIQDAPRFPFRGLLLDTSRHYEPVKAIKLLLDSMSYAKLNVFHWHIVDAQSFPLQSKSFPKLWEGAYSEEERYTLEDVKEIIEYAKDRVIRVIPEFDGPGHAHAWGVGYPEILPANYTIAEGCLNKCPPKAGNPCNVPLDPSKQQTYDLLQGLYNELLDGEAGSGSFPDTFFHVGGDEVNQECWNASSEIASWMKSKNFTSFEDAYMYFVSKAHDFTFANKRTPINWEEVFNHFGTKLDKRTIIHIWLRQSSLANVVNAGYRGILSAGWYLDHLTDEWSTYYMQEPLENITSKAAQKLVLGGAVCMWAETVDISDLFSTVWPRAAAVAERLWSAESLKDVKAAEPRFASFRCLLNERGVGAGPYQMHGRTPPGGPGACKTQ